MYDIISLAVNNSSLIWGTEPVAVYNLSQSMAEGLKIQSAGYISSWLIRKGNTTRAGQADDAETRIYTT